MGEKSRNGWGVKIDLCPKCHKIKELCKCKKEEK